MNKHLCTNEPIHLGMLSYTARTPNRRPFQRGKIKCPRCGRKLKPRIRECHDAGCWHLYVPIHKMKHWWKKDKKNLKRKIK